MYGLFNDPHRDKYVHQCTKCGQEILSYRNCTGEGHSRECDGKIRLVNVIEGIKTEDVHTPSRMLIKGCPNTKGRSFFEPAFGKKIHTGDIDILCKEKGVVYGGDDLSRDAAKNKEYHETNAKKEFQSELKSELSKVIN